MNVLLRLDSIGVPHYTTGVPLPLLAPRHPPPRDTLAAMCRSIKQLRGPEPAATGEVQAAALQFVRKISGYRAPARRNEAAFNAAVAEVAEASQRLLDLLARTDAVSRL
jgi:hypothetical protein